MPTLDAIRAAYAARFGAEFEAETFWDKRLRNELLVLCFWAGVPPVVYASLGGRGHEVTLVSPVPFHEFMELVGKVAHAASAAPGDVIACEIERTPFDGILLLPPEDGTFVLGHVDGVPRYALRAVPITPAERQLASGAPDELLDRLREAGALEADLLRDCVIEPERTRRFWALNKPVLFMDERRRLSGAVARRDRLLELKAPHEFVLNEDRLIAKRRAFVAYLTAPLADPKLLEQRVADHLVKEAMAYAEIVEHVIDARGSVLPMRLLRTTVQMIMLVLANHPIAVRLFAIAEGTGGSGKSWSADEALERSADMLLRHRPGLKREKLVSCGRAALEGAAGTFDPDSGVAFDTFVWAQIVGAMLMAAGLPPRGEGGTAEDALVRMEDQAIRSAYRDCPGAVMCLELEPDATRSPRERLYKIGDDLASQMLIHFAMAAKPQHTEH